jgi:hypothetical protein
VTHRFTKGVADYASGATALVESRVREFTKVHGTPPAQLLIHVPTARGIFTELVQRHHLPPVPQEAFRPGSSGAVDGIPFFICLCGSDMGEDLIIDWRGNSEPL